MGLSLSELLEQQKRIVLSFSTLLVRERQAIAERKPQQIEQVAQEKLELLNQIQQQDNLLGSHPDRQLLLDDEVLNQQVKEVQSMMHDCQQENLTNGEALQRAQLSNNKLNNMLQQSRGKSGMTYTSSGQTKNITSLGTNIKA
ncbi:flagella synthesis protein FlgN [Aliivibrio kagoshimensis]|jgi:flagella synthesis protein FlgN|uniref:flagella synthesis protein FlgN n=1 Tax=Aliivibrio kagoshimensis TaxID=2910230 RepID=UPI003D14AB67